MTDHQDREANVGRTPAWREAFWAGDPNAAPKPGEVGASALSGDESQERGSKAWPQPPLIEVLPPETFMRGPMTDREALDLGELRELCEKATEGPWVADDEAIVYAPSRKIAVIAWLRSEPDESGQTHPLDFGRDEDAAFIAAARTAVPELLDRLECAEGEAKEEWLAAERFERERDRYRAALEAILYVEHTNVGHPVTSITGTPICSTCSRAWPCPHETARAALGVEGEGT